MIPLLNTLQNINVPTYQFPPALTIEYKQLLKGGNGIFDLDVQDSVLAAISNLKKLPENWDGYGSLAPDPEAIQTAKSLVSLLPHLFQSGFKPEISADEDGRITMEWYRGPKTLALFIGAQETIVVQSWGPQNRIEDSLLDSPSELSKLRDWLYTR